MARGDDMATERGFSDRDDEGEELGGFSGGIPYDDDEDEDGGWVINKDQSDSLWDSAEESDDDDDAEATELVDAAEGPGDEEEGDLFGGSLSTPKRRGRKPGEKPAPATGEFPLPVAPKNASKPTGSAKLPAASKTKVVASPKAAVPAKSKAPPGKPAKPLKSAKPAKPVKPTKGS